MSPLWYRHCFHHCRLSILQFPRGRLPGSARFGEVLVHVHSHAHCAMPLSPPARRVVPSHFQGMWLIRLPDRIPRSAVFAELLGDRRVSLTPCGVLCDGVPVVGRDIASSSHLQVITILAEAYEGNICLHDNAQSARAHPGFLQHLWGGVQTTRTTTMAHPSGAYPTTRTTTQVLCPSSHPAAPLLSADVLFYISTVQGDVVTIAEVLFDLCQALLLHGCLQDGDDVQCHRRACVTPAGIRMFMHICRLQADAHCWILAPWMSTPCSRRCGYGLRRAEVLGVAGVSDTQDVRIFLEEEQQHEVVRPFQGDVVIVTNRACRVHSVPLHHLLHRIPDMPALLLRHAFPAGRTARDLDLHRAYWRSIAHSCHVAFGLHRPGVRSTLAGVTFPCMVICTGCSALPTTAQTQAHWDHFLKPLFGPCHLQCSATLERDHALYVQRMSSLQRQPWVVRLPFGVDTFTADNFGFEAGSLDLGLGWVLRAVSRHLNFGLASAVPRDTSRPTREYPEAVLAPPQPSASRDAPPATSHSCPSSSSGSPPAVFDGSAALIPPVRNATLPLLGTPAEPHQDDAPSLVPHPVDGFLPLVIDDVGQGAHMSTDVLHGAALEPGSPSCRSPL